MFRYAGFGATKREQLVRGRFTSSFGGNAFCRSFVGRGWELSFGRGWGISTLMPGFGYKRLMVGAVVVGQVWAVGVCAIAGVKLPTVSLERFDDARILQDAVPLVYADTGYISSGGDVDHADSQFQRKRYRRGLLLAKFKGRPLVDAVRVAPGDEEMGVRRMRMRPDVEFCELDTLQQRAFVPDDPLVAGQWHHAVLGSFSAWDVAPVLESVRIAIVDTPFQMDHPDLAANTDEGWDVVLGQPVFSGAGIAHSTLGAGLAAAVVNNATGVAGIAHSRLVPINIEGSLSDMYKAVIWAADHGVRVVNISWTGGDSDTLNAAANYLKEQARGVLVMAGGNSDVPAYATNQPAIFCVSMTDSADRMLSRSGLHVDFAAPGWSVFSTTTGASYGYGTGTSYAAPVFSGVVAQIMGINPLLSADEVIAILKQTAVDRGPAGWDEWYGWGRVDLFGAAAAAAVRLPHLTLVGLDHEGVHLAADYYPDCSYTLWAASSAAPPQWSPVIDALWSTNASRVLIQDPNSAHLARFYRLEVRVR